MQVEQPRDVLGVRAAHPALRADPPLATRERGVDVLDLGGGGALGLVVGVVGDEREVELGLRAGGQAAQRCEVARVGRAPGAR